MHIFNAFALLTLSTTSAATCITCPHHTCRINCAFDLGINNSTSIGSCIPCNQTNQDIVHVTLNLPSIAIIPSLHSLQLGINAIGGTWCPCGSAEKPCKNGPYNATKDILQLKPSLVRTHDTMLLTPDIYNDGQQHIPWGIRVLTWNSMYPDLKADPHNISSYNFTLADLWMQQWDALSIPRLLRLGCSVNQGPACTNISQVDVENLSEAFLYFVKHFNDGWGSKNNFKGKSSTSEFLKIKYIEVWNEPEGAFWTGTIATLQLLLYKTIHKLRQYDSSLYVGPNNACPFGDCTCNISKSDHGYELDAMDAIITNTHNVSLLPNLYSWHEYIYQNPTLTDRLYNTVQNELHARNFTSIGNINKHQYPMQQIITEWNPCAEGSCLKNKELNAWAAADFGQTVMVHILLGVNVSMPYPLCAVNTDWGLLSTTTTANSTTLIWRPQAYAFQMMSDVLHDTPYSFATQLLPMFDEYNDLPYFSTGFINLNRSKINIIYSSRMQNATDQRNQILFHFKNMNENVNVNKEDATEENSCVKYNVSCYVIDDNGSDGIARNYVQIGTTETIVIDSNGTKGSVVTLPHSFPGRTPSLMRLELLRVW